MIHVPQHPIKKLPETFSSCHTHGVSWGSSSEQETVLTSKWL